MKTLNLYKNEIVKASRKAAYIVLIILTAVSVLFTGGIFKFIDVLSSNDYVTGFVDEEFMSEYRESLRNDYENWKTESDLKLESNPGDIDYAMMVYFEEESWCYLFGEEEFGIAQGGYYTDNYKNAPTYITELFDDVIRMRAAKKAVEAVKNAWNISEDEAKAIMAEIIVTDYVEYDQAKEAKYVDVIKSNDFEKYVEIRSEIIKNDADLSEESKEIRLDGLEIMKKAFSKDLTEDQWVEISSGLAVMSDYRVAINEGINLNGEPLTEEQLDEYQKTVAEIKLSVEKKSIGYGGKLSSEASLYPLEMIEFGVSIATVLMIVMGTLLVAEEIQSGSIKLLIIAPVKRHRIFTAKLLTLVTAWLMETLLIYIFFALANLIFGFGSANMVFTFLGKACFLNFYVYYFFYVLLSMVKALVFGIFSLMMSTLLRNVGGALSISLVLLLVVDSLVSTVAMFFTSQMGNMIARFLPATNFDLSSKVFYRYTGSSSSLNDMLFGEMGAKQSSWQFSLIYLAVLTGILIFISYQSFEKRDIK